MIRNSQQLTLIFTYAIALLLSLSCTSRPNDGLGLNFQNGWTDPLGSNGGGGGGGGGGGKNGPIDPKNPPQKENLGKNLEVLTESTSSLKDKLGTENYDKLMSLIETYKTAYDKQYEALETQNAELLEEYVELAEEAAEEAEEIATSIETISGLETLAANYHEMANKHDIHIFTTLDMKILEIPLTSAGGEASSLISQGWYYWGVVYRLYKNPIHSECSLPLYACGVYNTTAPTGDGGGYHFGYWTSVNYCDGGGSNIYGAYGGPIGFACTTANNGYSVDKPILRYKRLYAFDVGDDQCSEEYAEYNIDCNANLYDNFDANGDGHFDLYIYSAMSVVDAANISILQSRNYSLERILGYSVP